MATKYTHSDLPILDLSIMSVAYPKAKKLRAAQYFTVFVFSLLILFCAFYIIGVLSDSPSLYTAMLLGVGTMAGLISVEIMFNIIAKLTGYWPLILYKETGEWNKIYKYNLRSTWFVFLITILVFSCILYGVLSVLG